MVETSAIALVRVSTTRRDAFTGRAEGFRGGNRSLRDENRPVVTTLFALQFVGDSGYDLSSKEFMEHFQFVSPSDNLTPHSPQCSWPALIVADRFY